MIPTQFTTTMRVRFRLSYAGLPPSGANTSYAISAGGISTGTGSINFYYNAANIPSGSNAINRSIQIPSHYFADLLWARITGTFRSDLPSTLDNRCEYACDKVTFYGPIHDTGSTTTIRVDWADGLPGVILTDASDRLSRSACAASPSRLQWLPYVRAIPPLDNFIGVIVGIPVTLNISSNATAVGQTDRTAAIAEMGTLDVVVHIRCGPRADFSSAPAVSSAIMREPSKDTKADMDFL
jgi:hypothetical protein